MAALPGLLAAVLPGLRAALLPGLLAALLLGGCLQDATNANKDFDFNNPVDPTPTNSSGIAIAAVDYLSSTQTVVIVNSSGSAQAMTGWALVNQNTSAKYTFGAVTLGTGSFVRVHPGTGTDSGTDVYSGAASATSPTWAFQNTALLQNATGGTVSSCQVGSPIC